MTACVLATACSTAPVAPSTRPHVGATVTDDVRVHGPTLDELALTELVTLETGSDTPSPSFDATGAWLVYRAERGESRTHDDAAEVRALQIGALEDRVVYRFEHQHNTAAYGVYPEMSPVGSGQGQAPSRDVAFHPAMLSQSVLMAGPSLGPYSAADLPDTYRASLTGRTVLPFGDEGGLPRVGSTGRWVMLQRASGIAVLEASGAKVRDIPGFFGVWSPDDATILAHVTPYVVPESSLGVTDWLSFEVEPPADNLGGLVRVRGDEVEQVTSTGGRPSWLPDGRAFVYERPTAAYGQGAVELVRHVLADHEEDTLVNDGRHPAVHPAGRLVFYEGPQGISVLDLEDAESARPLGIDGTEPQVSADGKLLCVLTAHAGRRGRPTRDIRIYALGP